MNCRLIILFLLLLSPFGLLAQGQYTTENPRVDDVNDRDVTIRRVELTDQYTIIYMTFRSRRSSGQMFKIPLPNGRGYSLPSTNTISFVPTARLYVNDGEKSFKFIRAENIPTEKRRDVSPGEQVDFVAYFERITPGYEVFDLFECSDQNRNGEICFNFWGVHITNPAKKPNARRAPATPPRQEAKPPVTPRPTPTVPTPEPEKPKPSAPATVAINGTVRDAKTKKPMRATIRYRLLSGAETSGDEPADSVRSDGTSGKYNAPGQSVAVYAVTASAKGYFSQSDTLATSRSDVTRNFDLTPIETGTKITLKNIYFNVSKFDLKPESFPELDRLAGIMQENPTMTIRLEGHTDIVGNFDANVELSRNRVNEVKRYLITKGIDSDRIDTVGYGPSRPINTNKSLKERPENRRVELVITKV